jgi:ribonuclease HII
MLKQCVDDGRVECGVDEAGRGALCGPVVAAGVIWDPKIVCDQIKDSKKLTAKKRKELSDFIKQNAIAYHIAFVDNTDIDTYNILNATMKAMHNAVNGLSVCPEHILVDGNRFVPHERIPHTCFVGGDNLYTSIAAASILAKVARDEYMLKLHVDHPQYKWDVNMGYGTRSHMQAIADCGVTEYHRKTFRMDKVW